MANLFVKTKTKLKNAYVAYVPAMQIPGQFPIPIQVPDTPTSTVSFDSSKRLSTRTNSQFGMESTDQVVEPCHRANTLPPTCPLPPLPCRRSSSKSASQPHDDYGDFDFNRGST